MENQESQKYYSEKLINLPGLGISYDLPNLKNIKKPNIQNQSNLTIFLNLQSLFKLLPEDDHIYLDIIKIHPNSYFWFLNRMNDSVTKVFKDRVSRLFQKEGYDFEKYFYFHSKCSQEEFFGLIEESDVILDSCNWSGGNTSLEAISLNKPIVTYPSNFMRGRYTYGILKILGIEETIATTKKNYVEIAVKLASDKNFINSIVDKIKKNKNKLFKDDKPLKFLEEVIRTKLI
jgi:predicted O-linked N-acetylglucosamine transferase (SPINDLY family)